MSRRSVTQIPMHVMGISEVPGPSDRPGPRDQNRRFGPCPRCGKKASIETGIRVSRDGGETWFLQTVTRCWSMARHRCEPTIIEVLIVDEARKILAK